jgi:UDP-3-O-[3-hydroxymyristoyl] N-acetylglucosamine deacetylase/3-hydroxyacyl-[acyl-carrier-protein] dehydratase
MDRLNILLKLLKRPELKNKNTKRNIYVVKEIISFTDEESGKRNLIMPNDSYCVTNDGRFWDKDFRYSNATMGIYEFKRNL